MAAPPAKERIGVLSAGLGGLPTLRECMLVRPDAEFVFLSDRALVAPAPETYEQVRARVECALAELQARGVRRVVAPGIPTGVANPTELPPEFAEFAESLLRLELAAASDASQRGNIAVVTTPLLANSWPHLDLRARSGSLSVAMCISETLAPVLDRGLDRDEISVEVVREVAGLVRETSADVVIFACQHAHLVTDLFRRSLGPSISVVASSELAASLLASPDHRALPGTPPVAVVTTSRDTDIVRDANRYLQAPITGVDRAELPPLQAEVSANDRISLFYAAFDRGDLAEAGTLFAADATIASEIPGKPCPPLAADALASCRRRLGHCVSVIEAFFGGGALVGASGWRLATDPVTAESSQQRFTHLFEFKDDLVRELRVLDPIPPWERDNAARPDLDQ